MGRLTRQALLVGVAALLVVGGVAAVLLTRHHMAAPADAPLHVQYGEIAEVQAYPVPEGSPPPPLGADPGKVPNGYALALIRSLIPSRLPAPVTCHYSGFGDGLQLTITLRDGRELDYYACSFPSTLRPLYEAAWRIAASPPASP